MALTYVGSLNLLALCPSVALSLGIPSLQLGASLTGNLALSASLTLTPPTAAFYLAAAIETQVQLLLAESLGAPDFSFSVSDVVSLQADLNASFSLLASLSALLSLSLAGGGVYAFSYSGAADGMGAALTSELAVSWPDGVSTSGTAYALIFGASSSGSPPSPIAQTSMTDFLNGLMFSSGLVYTGKLGTIADVSKVTAQASVEGSAAISASLAASASLSVAASVGPPSFAVTATALANFIANLRASLALKPPSVSVAISATASAAASISANFGAMASLGAALGGGGSLFVYTYTGAGNALGAAVTSALASTWGDGHTSTAEGDAVSVILAVTDPFAFTSLLSFFGGA